MKNIIELLNIKSNVDEYKIVVSTVSSTELFFIKEELQMNRSKDVKHINITIYRNFVENDIKFKGSSTTVIEPTMSMDEISKKIDTAALAASFVKNQFYNLVDPTNDVPTDLPSTFKEGNPIEHISNLVKDIFSEDNQFEAFINSCEFFINKKDIRILNSKGVDVSYTVYDGEIELITEANGEKESIELFDVLNFSDYDPAWIKETVKDSLYKSMLRTKAVPISALKDIPVILTGEAVQDFFSYYQVKAAAQMIYQKISTVEIGDMVQQGEIKGDLVTATLKPYIPNSSKSRSYDDDGFFLKEITIIKDSKLLGYYAQKRYADYLGITPTGGIQNIEINCGSTSIDDLKKGPYLELLNFSDFQMDPLTGNFGGEIRLGIYFDGTLEIPVTLGSISGVAKDVEGNMLFSKEQQKLNSFIGPKFIKLNNISIAGN